MSALARKRTVVAAPSLRRLEAGEELLSHSKCSAAFTLTWKDDRLRAYCNRCSQMAFEAHGVHFTEEPAVGEL